MNNKIEWPPGPVRPILKEREVHIWRTALDRNRTDLEFLHSNLSPDEVSRAARFHFDKHRSRFTTGRGILREILSRYILQRPQEIVFEYGSFGKPALKDQTPTQHLRFNLSHSEGLALIILADSMEVGIDLEHIQPDRTNWEMAERHFSSGEVAALRALPVNAGPEAFYNCWTRKEAYIKAIGNGLQISLDSFEVSVAPDEPAKLLKGETSKWQLHSLNPAPGYAAAFVTEGTFRKLHCFEWSGFGLH